MSVAEGIAEMPDGVRAVCFYGTPERRASVHALRDTLIPVLWIGLSGLGALGVLAHAPLTSPGHVVLACLATAGVCYPVSWAINHALADAACGYWRTGLTVAFTDATIKIQHGRRSEIVKRGAHAFFVKPHRKREEELREERRIGRPLVPVYRDAFQVWLKHDIDFVELASVAEEEEASRIVRVLQKADSMVAGQYRGFDRRVVPD